MKPATRKSSIPQDIIFQVFSWLPVKSLMRFRCVSKFCNFLVSESVFVDIHHCRSMTRTGGTKFIVCRNYRYAHLYTIEQNEEGKASRLHIEYSGIDLFRDRIMCVNGLFCCTTRFAEPVAICNPSTRVVRTLPSVEINYRGKYFYSLGFDPEEKTYKVLMILNNDELRRMPTRTWVFTLGVDKSWREIKSVASYLWIENGIHINGVIYMLNTVRTEIFIVAFDVKTENLRIITLWNNLYHSQVEFYYKLTEIKGKLAILDCEKKLYYGAKMNLWILGKIGKEEWEKHIIKIRLQWKGLESEVSKSFIFEKIRSCCDGEIFSYDGKILFPMAIKSGKIICLSYDVAKKKWRHFEIQGLPTNSLIRGIISCDESLFPVEKI